MNDLIEKAVADRKDQEKYLCRTDLKYLCRDILNFKDWDICHDEMDEWSIENSDKRFKLYLLPRGHLKTSVLTIGRTIQDILKDHNASILLASAVWDNARSFLSEIKDILENNVDLKDLYGSFVSPHWNSDEITIRQRSTSSKTKTIETTGIEKTKTSQHYNIIRADDLVTRENISTSDQIDKVVTYFRDLIKMIEPGGTMEVIGTRWHDADVYGHIIRELTKESFKESKFAVYTRKAIENDIPIFPKKFSVESLRILKAQVGSYEFSANYDNSPIDPESQKFKPPVRYWNDLGPNPLYQITVDPAISMKKDSCDGVVMVCAINASNQVCVVEYSIHKESDKVPSRMIEKIFEFVSKYPNKGHGIQVGIEAVGYQAALCRLVEEEMRKRNVFFNVVEIKQHKDKNMRILELTPRWESGNLLLKQGMVELEDQLLRFPIAEKVDILDTLQMQTRLGKPDIAVKRNLVYVPQKFRGRAA